MKSTKRATLRWAVALAVLACAPSSCVGDSSNSDASAEDAGTDTGSDAAPDVAPDTGTGSCTWDQGNWDECVWQ